jgi:hypothetical protein
MMLRRTRTIRPEPWRFARPRALIEHADPAVAFDYVSVLRRAGYSVAICPGPSGSPDSPERCALTTGEPCTLVDGADVVVSCLGVEAREKRAVLESLRRHHPDKPLVVEIAAGDFDRYEDLLAGAHVIVSPVEGGELLAAVNDAVHTAAPEVATSTSATDSS